MNCAAPFCKGLTHDLICTEHDAVCSECGIPTYHYRPDKKCATCGARQDGEKCGGCGSPWVYMPYFEDGLWRCRPCVTNIMHENGWLQTPEEVRAWLKEKAAAERERQARIEAQREKEREVQGRLRKVKKPKQGEELFK